MHIPVRIFRFILKLQKGRFILAHKLLISISWSFNTKRYCVCVCVQSGFGFKSVALFEVDVTGEINTVLVAHNFHVVVIACIWFRQNQHGDERVSNSTGKHFADAVLTFRLLHKVLASYATNYFGNNDRVPINQHFRIAEDVAWCTAPRRLLLYPAMIDLLIWNNETGRSVTGVGELHEKIIPYHLKLT